MSRRSELPSDRRSSSGGGRSATSGEGRDEEISIAASLGAFPLQGEEVRELTAALGIRHPSVLRCRREADPESFGWPLEPVPWYQLAFRCLDPAIRPSRTLPYAAGEFFLQDAGSLLALAACGADRAWAENGSGSPPAASSAYACGAGARTSFPLVCDLCAAPGGKASALVEAVGEWGYVLANEPIRSRIAPLAYNLARTGSDRYAITSLDPEQLAEALPGSFDLVLVDAPCSGQALLGRGRQTAAAWSEKQIAHSAARQRRILDAATALLRPGGQLVYSTCTFATAENESQVERLVREEGLQPDPVERLETYRSPLTPASYRLWPHRHATAGSFAASLRRVDGSPLEVATRPTEKRRGGKRRATKGRSEDVAPQAIGDWLTQLESTTLQTHGAVLIGWPSGLPEGWRSLAVAGPELAHRTGKTWKPSHAAALRRVARGRPSESYAVDESTAWQLLAGQPIPCSRRGWVAVTWNGRPLGWVKSDGKVGKNHLPAAARLQGPAP